MKTLILAFLGLMSFIFFSCEHDFNIWDSPVVHSTKTEYRVRKCIETANYVLQRYDYFYNRAGGKTYYWHTIEDAHFVRYEDYKPKPGTFESGVTGIATLRMIYRPLTKEEAFALMEKYKKEDEENKRTWATVKE